MVKPQGRHGEVAVELFTSFPERFEDRRKVWALDAKGARTELRVDEFWEHKGRLILKFGGIDSINDAEALIGSEIQIPQGERVELEPGAAYVSDLVGCSVFAVQADGLHEVGAVTDVTFGAGEAPLLIVKQGTRELMLPFATEFIAELDTPARRIEMKLPEGMLELDAPLSTDEKKEMHEGN